MISIQDHRFIPQTPCFPQIPTTHPRHALQTRISLPKDTFLPRTPPSRLPNPLQNHPSISKIVSFFHSQATHLGLMASLSSPLPSLAAEAEQVSSKINLESIVVSIDDFFNQNPFFVAGVTFVWLVVIPLAEEYLKKCKFISAIDAFRKLRDDPGSQLLDIRRKQSAAYLSSPNLKILKKNSLFLEFVEGEEEGFMKEVLKRFPNPENTVICVLDNFDGNSLKAAELLFKNGFKEAYAIKGGLRGKDGWQEIQEKLLPPAVHVYPINKTRTPTQPELNSQRVGEQNIGNGQLPTSGTDQDNLTRDSGTINTKAATPEAKFAPQKSLSPFPNYPDLKPPSSPTPSKP